MFCKRLLLFIRAFIQRIKSKFNVEHALKWAHTHKHTHSFTRRCEKKRLLWQWTTKNKKNNNSNDYKQFSRRSKWWQNQRFQLNCVSGRWFGIEFSLMAHTRIHIIYFSFQLWSIQSTRYFVSRFFSCVFIFLFTSIIGYPLYICWHGIHPSLQYTYFYQIELNFVNSSATSLLSYVVVTVEWVIILVFLFLFCRCSFSGFLFSLNPCRMYMYSLFICWHVILDGCSSSFYFHWNLIKWWTFGKQHTNTHTQSIWNEIDFRILR